MTVTELDIQGIDTGRIHLIEANAGTGKTYAIANLFLRWVLEGRRAREILVVTFTNAATDELRGRIRQRLAEARQLLRRGRADEEADPWFASLPERHPKGEARDRALLQLELALLEIGEAPIHTIHGFCQQTLAQQALASGQPFEPEQVEPDAAIERLTRDWWRRNTYGLSPPQAERLQQALGGFKGLHRKIRRLLSSPTLELYPPLEEIARLRKELETLAGQWEEQKEHLREMLLDPRFPLNRGRHRIPTLEKSWEALEEALSRRPVAWPSPESLQKLALDQFAFRKEATPEQKERLENDPLILQLRALRRELEALPPIGQVEVLARAREEIGRELRRENRRLGRQSFNDMVLELHHALQDHSGPADRLASRVAGEHPVIMVDEFQDTDPLQYEIFSRIHRAGRAEGHTLILIGDPKQAIYAFRGGDIFTYLQAGRDADRHWSLSVNWRSTPELIEAVNALFTGPDPFVYEEIPYHPSRAPAERRADPLRVDGRPEAALVLEPLPRDGNGEPFRRKDAVEALVHRSVAGRIAELLALAREGRAMLGDRPLQPGDIAVLVKSHQEGAAIRDALLQQGVRAVSAGRESIWQSAEAEALLRLLEAAILPGERLLQRQALAVDLFDLRVEELHRYMTDAAWWSRWVALLAGTGERWRRQGFMAGFQHLLQELAGLLPGETGEESGWLSRVEHPERTLTNLLHLADLLQAASLEQGTPEQLLAWMKARMQEPDAGADDSLPRLESDEELVRITTIHASKGLQYPLVFVPYLWNLSGGGSQGIDWHETDGDGRLHHWYSPASCKRGADSAARERLAEAVRLAYVALTRAQSHCHLHFGRGGSNRDGSALAWLFSGQEHDFSGGPFREEEEIRLPQRLAAHPHIRVIQPEQTASAAEVQAGAPAPATPPAELRCSAFTRALRRNWRIGSFSAMTRGVHQATQAPAATGAEHFALRYPAGAQVGNLLHGLLEQIDPREALEPQVRNLARWMFPRFGIPEDEVYGDLTGLATWIGEVLDTPLDESGLTLRGLEPGRTLRELQFDLGTGLIRKEAVNELLARAAGGERTPLEFEEFQGMLTGAIDLVFEHGGRYFLADYKSNLLGRTLEDYRPQRLQREILDRHYDLQYLIYTLALHRHLRNSLPGYDYEHHFGGVFYLFLRGMRPQVGPKYGVWFGRPGFETVQLMDRQIIGLPADPPRKKGFSPD